MPDLFYIISIVFLCIISLIDFEDIRLRKIAFYASLFFFFFIAAFRDNVGLDDASYKQIYLNIANDFGGSRFSFFNYFQEPLFIALNVLLIFIDNPQAIFVAFSALSFIFLGKAYIKYAGFFVLPLVIYYSHRFLHNDLNQIRQGLVSVFFLFSLKYIQHWKKFLTLTIIAMGFQISAFFFFIFFITKNFISKQNPICLIVFCFIVSNFLTIELFGKFIPEDSKAIFYLLDNKFNSSRFLFTSVTFWKAFLVFCFCYYYYSRLDAKFQWFKILFACHLFGLLTLILFQKIAIFSGRISTLFFTVEPILIFYIADFFYSRKQKMLLYFIIFIISIITLFLNISSEQSPVYQYKNIF